MLLNIIFRFLEILVYFLFAILKSNLFSHYVSKCNFMPNFNLSAFSGKISLFLTYKLNTRADCPTVRKSGLCSFVKCCFVRNARPNDGKGPFLWNGVRFFHSLGARFWKAIYVHLLLYFLFKFVGDIYY